MNLPVAPVLPDTSSIAAAAAASSAASASSLSAKSALTTQSGDDTSAAPTSFDHVFASVGDADHPCSTASVNTKVPSKAGKGACAAPATTLGSQTASSDAPTSQPAAAAVLTPGALVLAKRAANSQPTPGTLPAKQENHGNHLGHGARKKQENSDTDSPATDSPRSTISSALNTDQIAAALASAMTTPVTIQNLNTPPKGSLDTTNDANAIKLKGAKGRSVIEVLAQGTPVLNFQVAANAANPAQPTDGATVVSASANNTANAESLPAVETDANSSEEAAELNLSEAAKMGSTAPKQLPRASFENSAQSTTNNAANSASGAPSQATLSANPNLPSTAPVATAQMTQLPQNQNATAAQLLSPGSSQAADATIPAGDSAPSDDMVLSSSKQTPGTLPAAVSSGAKAIAPSTARAMDLTSWQKPVGAAQGPAEKFADSGSRQGNSGDDSSNRFAKNIVQPLDNKSVNKYAAKIGTDTAIGSAPMTSNLHAFAPTAATGDVFATASSSAVSTTAGTHAVAVSHAAALVHQINEIGDGLWRVDRQSVEVNFNFGDKDHLSVRVEYKNGQVQATFNTSSTELRTAITQAWNSQNASSGDRSYKMADPVFTSSSNSSFSSGEDSSSNPRQFSSFEDVTNFAGASRSRFSASTVSAPASASPRSSLRPEVAGHLNAIV